MLIATLPGNPVILIDKSVYAISQQNSLFAIADGKSLNLTAAMIDEKQSLDEVFLKNPIIMADLIEAEIISAPIRIIEKDSFDCYVCKLLK